MKIKKSYRWALKNGSGRIGDKIVYTRLGKTYIRKAAVKNDTPTERQIMWREKFKAAREFAHSIINDPILKAVYIEKAAGQCSAYSKAISEFMLRV